MQPTIRGEFRLATALCVVAFCSSISAQDDWKTIPKDKKVEEHASGIKYSILVPGTGKDRPAPGDEAIIHFTEWLDDGTVINSSHEKGKPVRILIGQQQAPLAFTVATTMLTKGGKMKLTVPPDKAYGEQGIVGQIPPNSTIVYVIELVDFVYRPKAAEFIPGDPEKTKTTESGLKYQVLQPGVGESPKSNDIVELEYTQWTLKGEVMGGSFQHGGPIKAPIQSMSHPFFREIMPLMNKGAIWRIVVPAKLTVEQVNQDTVWQIKLVSFEKAPTMPPSNEKNSTSTKSGLLYERLAEGKGDRPKKDFNCQIEWSFWKEDGTFVAGSELQGPMQLKIGDALHKFLNVIVKRMQVGEVMRVEVPDTMTPPRMMPFKTIWRLKLLSMQAPLPTPEFQMPKDEELETTKSGLRYKILVKGDGKALPPKMGEQVTVHYAGWLANGTAFDGSFKRSQPAVFRLGQVIPGWNEGLQLMQPGDTFLFVIPSKLGFGARGAGQAIPPDATLVFHIQLIKVEK